MIDYRAYIYDKHIHRELDLAIKILMLSYPQNRLAFTFLNKGRYGLAGAKGFLNTSHLVLKEG